MIGFGQAITRRLFDIIEISSCFGLIAFVLAKSNKNGQRLGDLVARTIVVDKKAPDPTLVFDFERENKR